MHATNDPSLRSFIEVPAESHFPIQNLPYGAFRRRSDRDPAVGIAIGDYILDLVTIEREGLLTAARFQGGPYFSRGSLNHFMAAGHTAWRAVRATVTNLLRGDEPTIRDNKALRDRAFVPMS